MKTPRTIKGASAISAAGKAVVSADRAVNVPPNRRQRLLEHWRRLATGLRGVRLFRITVVTDGKIFWEAGCKLNRDWVSRRFASELHARAWLSVAAQSHVALSSVEVQELKRPCSTSCFASGG